MSAEAFSSNPGFSPVEVAWPQKKGGKIVAYNLDIARCGARGRLPSSPANSWAGKRRSGYSCNVSS